ncbi:MAG TPA: MEKHLA domain-containing protein [Methylotenera sp.]|nr:MEKHLA domain-containing protein [Methylotenera sp.]
MKNNHPLSAEFLLQHTQLLIQSYQHWTGKALITNTTSTASNDVVQSLLTAPFAVASHDTQADPVFNYANHQALTLFKMNADEMLGLPSRYSAEPTLQEGRAEFLEKVAKNGFVDDYSGIRIAKDGSRFLIEQVTVWNLIDVHQAQHKQAVLGQAVLIKKWHRL